MLLLRGMVPHQQGGSIYAQVGTVAYCRVWLVAHHTTPNQRVVLVRAVGYGLHDGGNSVVVVGDLQLGCVYPINRRREITEVVMHQASATAGMNCRSESRA